LFEIGFGKEEAAKREEVRDMAHKKGAGSSRNGRDSQSQRRGVKAFAGQLVTGGSILVRQCGNQHWAGANVDEGRDGSLFAKIPGVVQYEQRGRRNRRYVHIIPVEETTSSS